MPTAADRKQTRSLTDLRVSTQTVQAIAVRNMREAIMSGVFQPGERLVESEMCSRLGISRPSLREALRSLEAEKLVVIVPNKGPAIPILTIEEARQIYDVRVLLEGEAAALSASRRSDVDVAQMRSALKDFDAAVASRNLDALIRATRTFYDQVIKTCGNDLIGELLNSQMARITFLRSKSMSLEGRAPQSSRELWEILESIASGKPDEARKAAARHVAKAKEAAVKAYKRTPFGRQISGSA